MKLLPLIISLGISINSFSQWESIQIPEDIFLDQIEILDNNQIIVSGHKSDFTGTHAGIYLSANDGESWNLVNSFDFAGQKISAMEWINSGKGFIGSESEFNDGVLLSTEDQGVNLFWVSSLSEINGVKDIDFYAGTYGVVLSSDNELFFTSDAGNSWTKKNYNSNLSIAAVKIVAPSIIYIAGTLYNGEEVAIHKSSDTGINWISVYNEVDSNIDILSFEIKNSAFLSWNSDNYLRVVHSLDGNDWNEINIDEAIYNSKSATVISNKELIITSLNELTDSSAINTLNINGSITTEYVSQDTLIAKAIKTSNNEIIGIGDYGMIYKKGNPLSVPNIQDQINFYYSPNLLSWNISDQHTFRLNLFSLTGQVVESIITEDSEFHLNDLQKGCYIAQIISIDGSIRANLKFVH